MIIFTVYGIGIRIEYKKELMVAFSLVPYLIGPRRRSVDGPHQQEYWYKKFPFQASKISGLNFSKFFRRLGRVPDLQQILISRSRLFQIQPSLERN